MGWNPCPSRPGNRRPKRQGATSATALKRLFIYELVEQHYPAFLAALQRDGRSLPAFVQQVFEAYLKCGRLEHGFLRVRCTRCHAERLVAFSCKRRGFCPSCGARRMVETAALLVDAVLPRQPLRQVKMM